MRRTAGFTLIEIAIAVFIMLLLVLIAVPSLSGVAADRRLKRSLDSFNSLVRQAGERSMQERRPYLIAWERNQIILRPEAFAQGEEEAVTASYRLGRGEIIALRLPASLIEKPPAEWIFWPSGNCEPAIIEYRGPDGTWRQKIPGVTIRPELVNYAAG